MTDAMPVRFEVLGVERLAGAGRVLALANVLVEVAGVSFELQGLHVVKEARGLGVETPQFRHPRQGGRETGGAAALGKAALAAQDGVARPKGCKWAFPVLRGGRQGAVRVAAAVDRRRDTAEVVPLRA